MTDAAARPAPPRPELTVERLRRHFGNLFVVVEHVVLPLL